MFSGLVNLNFSNTNPSLEGEGTGKIVEKIQRIESAWLSDNQREMERLASLGFTHSVSSFLPGSFMLPVLHALELEKAFEATHHVFAYSQSFSEGVVTMLIKSIKSKNSKQELPYREEFRLDRGFHSPDEVEEKIRKCGKQFIEDAQMMIKGASDLKNLMTNFSTDKLRAISLDLCVNIFLERDIAKYDSAYQFLSVSRLSSPSSFSSFIFCDNSIDKVEGLLDRDLGSLKYDSLKTIKSLFQWIFESRDSKINTGMLNVILIPKNSAANVFYYPPADAIENTVQANLYMGEMAKNPEIYTIRLVNDDRAFMNKVKNEIDGLNIQFINWYK